MENTFKLLKVMRNMAIIALVAVIGFSMTACGKDDEPDLVPADLLGKWETIISEKNEDKIFSWTFSENDKLTFDAPDDYSYTIGNLNYKMKANDFKITGGDSIDISEYSLGFLVKGKVESVHVSEEGLNEGDNWSHEFYLNKDKDKFWNPYPFSSEVYIKKQ